MPRQSIFMPKRDLVIPVQLTVSSTLPSGTQGIFYSTPMTATGGTPPYTWSVVQGSLDSGITLAPNGTLSGTPLNAETDTFIGQVTDSKGAYTQDTFTLTFASSGGGGGPLAISTPSPLNAATRSSVFSQTLTATGGKPPYNWSRLSNTGMNTWTVSPSGNVTGTPVSAEIDYLYVKVTDQLGATATALYVINVASNGGTFDFYVSPTGGGAFKGTLAEPYRPQDVFAMNIGTFAAQSVYVSSSPDTQIGIAGKRVGFLPGNYLMPPMYGGDPLGNSGGSTYYLRGYGTATAPTLLAASDALGNEVADPSASLVTFSCCTDPTNWATIQQPASATQKISIGGLIIDSANGSGKGQGTTSGAGYIAIRGIGVDKVLGAFALVYDDHVTFDSCWMRNLDPSYLPNYTEDNNGMIGRTGSAVAGANTNLTIANSKFDGMYGAASPSHATLTLHSGVCLLFGMQNVVIVNNEVTNSWYTHFPKGCDGTFFIERNFLHECKEIMTIINSGIPTITAPMLATQPRSRIGNNVGHNLLALSISPFNSAGQTNVDMMNNTFTYTASLNGQALWHLVTYDNSAGKLGYTCGASLRWGQVYVAFLNNIMLPLNAPQSGFWTWRLERDSVDTTSVTSLDKYFAAVYVAGTPGMDYNMYTDKSAGQFQTQDNINATNTVNAFNGVGGWQSVTGFDPHSIQATPQFLTLTGSSSDPTQFKLRTVAGGFASNSPGWQAGFGGTDMGAWGVAPTGRGDSGANTAPTLIGKPWVG